MTKKTFLFACLLGAFAPGTRAHQYTPKHVSVLTMEEGKKLLLHEKTNSEDNGKPEPRTLIPEVTLQGNRLHFITPCNGCAFQLVQGNDICYEVDITGNTLTIPTTFTGMYELQIVSGDIIFYTEKEATNYTFLLKTQLEYTTPCIFAIRKTTYNETQTADIVCSHSKNRNI